ncbi:MAG TPA: AGE family epimerase/isomerase [Steroidobacteraceae bacterium]|jgi:mannose-6-phosphate isomerase
MSPPESAQAEYRALRQWLLTDALPRWARDGYDPIHGGFHEKLTAAGPVADLPRRARVQVRQIYTFARAMRLGWDSAQAQHLVSAGVEYFLRHYRRADGLFRTLVAADGSVLDERVFLYDQAFVLLALAECQKIGGPDPELIVTARELCQALHRHLSAPGPGFFSGLPDTLPLLSNPHMHLLEAALSWCSVSDEAVWRTLADEIVALALRHFIDARTGALREQFDRQWRPLPGVAGRLVEPGHQFEWSWLLLCWRSAIETDALQAARRLAQIGETYGVRADVAINELLDDFNIHNAEARLWPQTERLKAAVRLAATTGESGYWQVATKAAVGLRRYLRSDAPGLWHDRLKADGQFVIEPAPASSFYHIICAIGEFGDGLMSLPAVAAAQ